ncbi:MAG TPA: hypothetical protein VLJ59_12610 [Mycobacteriales bacterium]|nr:hypothetical protein [Mycobacteriales bacterium]
MLAASGLTEAALTGSERDRADASTSSVGVDDLAGLYASVLAPARWRCGPRPDPGAAFRRFWVHKEAAVKLCPATLDALPDLGWGMDSDWCVTRSQAAATQS